MVEIHFGVSSVHRSSMIHNRNYKEPQQSCVVFIWPNVVKRFADVFDGVFSTSKKAHFDCLPPEYKIVDGARTKWRNLLILDAVIYFLNADEFTFVSRRAFNQQRVLYESIMAELRRLDYKLFTKATNFNGDNLDKSLASEVTSKVVVEQLLYPWNSLENLRYNLQQEPPSKSKDRYIASIDMLCGHQSLLRSGLNDAFTAVIVKAISATPMYRDQLAAAAIPKPPKTIRTFKTRAASFDCDSSFASGADSTDSSVATPYSRGGSNSPCHSNQLFSPLDLPQSQYGHQRQLTIVRPAPRRVVKSSAARARSQSEWSPPRSELVKSPASWKCFAEDADDSPLAKRRHSHETRGASSFSSSSLLAERRVEFVTTRVNGMSISPCTVTARDSPLVCDAFSSWMGIGANGLKTESSARFYISSSSSSSSPGRPATGLHALFPERPVEATSVSDCELDSDEDGGVVLGEDFFDRVEARHDRRERQQAAAAFTTTRAKAKAGQNTASAFVPFDKLHPACASSSNTTGAHRTTTAATTAAKAESLDATATAIDDGGCRDWGGDISFLLSSSHSVDSLQLFESLEDGDGGCMGGGGEDVRDDMRDLHECLFGAEDCGML